jgi:hypothetical protein
VKDFRPGSRWLGGEEEADKRVHASVRGEREDAEDGRHEIKKKTYFCKYANDARGPSGYEASGPGWWDGGLGGLGRLAGQGRVGVVAGPADMGRAEVADSLGVRIREGKAVF